MRRISFFAVLILWSTCVWFPHVLKANNIVLKLTPNAEIECSKENVKLTLTAASEEPLPLRINFWTGVFCVLENIDGKELNWSGVGSDSLRTPPPPEAIPSLIESGSASVSLDVSLTFTKENANVKNAIIIQTEWGCAWWINSLPKEGVYIRARVKGFRKIKAESFIDLMIVKSIGKRGYAMISEDALLSNRVWIRREGDGALKVSLEEQNR